MTQRVFASMAAAGLLLGVMVAGVTVWGQQHTQGRYDARRLRTESA